MIRLAVCAGKDCAKEERKRYRRVLDAMRGVDLVRTPCLGVCEGPVVVIHPLGDTPVVVQRVKKSHVAELRRHVEQGTTPSPSSELRLVTKPKKRAKAAARARRAARVA